MSTGGPVIELRKASLRFGDRSLWEEIDLEVSAGEFLAVLGPNGAGKTSLLRVLLGLTPLSAGDVSVLGMPPERGDSRLGYVPQQRAFDDGLPLRGRDLVALGVDGHRWGVALPSRARRDRVDRAIAAVDAESFAGAPVWRLSGGEHQRLRVAQALVSDPALLLCDEPLLSLDLNQQR
ncbi:MAG: metal ABC transporter ATP-binding protein, partial [Acidimicrobiales bacterium]